MTSGVPQGSVLAPLLFVIYINDMPDEVKHIIKLLADDSKLIATIRSATDLEVLQRDLEVFQTGVRPMMFNVEKCKVMEFGTTSKSGHSKLSSTELRMGESRSVLNFKNSEKDLGVTFSSNFKFSRAGEQGCLHSRTAQTNLQVLNRHHIQNTLLCLRQTSP